MKDLGQPCSMGEHQTPTIIFSSWASPGCGLPGGGSTFRLGDWADLLAAAAGMGFILLPERTAFELVDCSGSRGYDLHRLSLVGNLALYKMVVLNTRPCL